MFYIECITAHNRPSVLLTQPYVGHPESALAQVPVPESRGNGDLLGDLQGLRGRRVRRQTAEQQLLLGHATLVASVPQDAERAAGAELLHAVEARYRRPAASEKENEY